jgi:hypothetical protein
MKGSNRVCLLSAHRRAGVAKGGRILERRSGDPDFWTSRPTKATRQAFRMEWLSTGDRQWIERKSANSSRA